MDLSDVHGREALGNLALKSLAIGMFIVQLTITLPISPGTVSPYKETFLLELPGCGAEVDHYNSRFAIVI